MQAAIGLAQLENCNQAIEKKQYLADFYISSLKDYPVTFQRYPQNSYHSYWMVSFLCQSKGKRDLLRKFLKEKNIETRPHFYPAHLLPPYNKGEKFKNAEEISDRGITLPSFPSLKREELNYIVRSIISFFRK